MSLIMPGYKHIELRHVENRNEYVIDCSSGVRDKLIIFRDREGSKISGSVGFRVEDENDERSQIVFVNQETLPELILLLQSMRGDEE